jgi:molybdate transport system substrate-binding protein
MSRQFGRRVVVIASALLAAACGSSSKPPASGGGPGDTRAVSARGQLEGPLNVFAAASLTESFTDEKQALATSAPGLSLTLNFAGSQALVTQIENGAPADVFASADEKTMQKLVDKGLVESPRTFARNALEIAVQPGNPKKITTLEQLAAPGVQTVTCAPAVPCGAAAHTLLSADGVKLTPVSEEQNVTAVITKVASGAADAGLVYVTDVKAAKGDVTGVGIPDADKAINSYPITVVKNAPDRAVATAFVDYVLSPVGRKVLRSYGFGAP